MTDDYATRVVPDLNANDWVWGATFRGSRIDGGRATSYAEAAQAARDAVRWHEATVGIVGGPVAAG